MSIDMTCVLFAFHSQQVKQSAYDNLPPLLTTPFSSLVMNMLVLDLRPVWRWEGCAAAQELPGTVRPTALSGEASPSAVPSPRTWPFSPPWQRRSRWTWRSSWAVEWRDRRGWGRLGLGLQSSYTVPSKKP